MTVQPDERPAGAAPLRVLHLGNVANNGYLNAKFLNDAGYDCDVLSYSHYHLMSSPEWEDSDYSGGPIEPYRPDWTAVDLRGFHRPEWFAEGPFETARAYLIARRRRSASAAWHRRWLDARRQMIVGRRWSALRRARNAFRSPAAAPAQPPIEQTGTSGDHQLARRFAEAFPDRSDRLRAAEVAQFGGAQGWSAPGLRALFDEYDVVHAYGSEPILPMIAGRHPWVAYEHGTIRAMPFAPTPIGRLLALAYRDADAVIITNADNRRAAERLGIERFRFVPHPVNEYVPDAEAVGRLQSELRARLSADFIVLHPSRHHWTAERNPSMEKGNDRLIDGLARLFAARPRAGAIFVNWGETAAASRSRLAAHGITDKVLWMDPVPTPALSRYMAAADVVADQFFLGAFGAITPRALFLGVPPLLHLDVDAHRWCFPEMPPVLNAQYPDEIAKVLIDAADHPQRRRELGANGRRWYAAHHSKNVIVNGLTQTYAAVLAGARVA